MEWIEKFIRDGKEFIYSDFSGLTTDKVYTGRTEYAVSVIEKSDNNSLYIIANANSVRFDSNTKKITARFIEKIKPYVKSVSVIGVDGIKKLMISAAMKMDGQMNIYFAYSKEDAIDWLLKHG